MSPSESQLRAALHEGEGDPLDAGLLIAHANRLRRDRRQRVNRLAGATLVVGLIGGGLMLLGRNGGMESGGGSSAGGGGGMGGAASAEAAPGAQNRPASATAPATSVPSRSAGGGGGVNDYGEPTQACPKVPDRVEVRSGLTEGGAVRALVPINTTSIRACAYPGGALQRTALFQSDRAKVLSDAVNSAGTEPAPAARTCTKDEPTGTVELLPYSPNGKRAKPVVVTVTCPNAIATNGVVTRYFVVAPKLLSNLLR